MCFIFVFQKHMVDVSYSIFSISSHVFILALPFIYQITALETLKSVIFTTINNLANSQILRKKITYQEQGVSKSSVFLRVLRKYLKILQTHSDKSQLSLKVKESLVLALNSGRVLHLVNLIFLVSVSTLVSALKITATKGPTMSLLEPGVTSSFHLQLSHPTHHFIHP